MAYSTQRAVSDGTMTYLDLAIGYQSRTDIKVFFNDLPAAPGTWAWVGTTDKRISFTPAVPNGVEVLVQRTTRLDRIINIFTGGAKFTNNTMDMNFEQVLFLTQEAVEGSALSDIFNDVDFHNFKIKNLGLAVDPTDAITYGQVQSMSTGAYQAQLAAEAARDLAALWATKLTTTVDGTSFSAKQYALNAGASSTSASTSAQAAGISAGQAGASATASQSSRLASEAARDASITARDAAAASAAAALASKNAAATSETNAAASADEAEYWVGQVAGGPVASVAGLTGVVAKQPLIDALEVVTSETAKVIDFEGPGFTKPYLWRNLAVPTDGVYLAALSADGSGVNSDIKSLTGLTTPLSVAQGGTGATTILEPIAQVRFGVTNSVVVSLAPFNGGNLLIGGVVRKLTGPVNLASTGMTINVVRYVYAYWTGTAVAIEASTTVPDFTGVMPIKTGDASRTLVGVFQCDTANTFQEPLTSSYWNRAAYVTQTQLSVDTPMPGPGIGGLGIPIRRMLWSGQRALHYGTGNVIFGTSGTNITVFVRLLVNGAQVGTIGDSIGDGGKRASVAVVMPMVAPSTAVYQFDLAGANPGVVGGCQMRATSNNVVEADL